MLDIYPNLSIFILAKIWIMICIWKFPWWCHNLRKEPLRIHELAVAILVLGKWTIYVMWIICTPPTHCKCIYLIKHCLPYWFTLWRVFFPSFMIPFLYWLLSFLAYLSVGHIAVYLSGKALEGSLRFCGIQTKCYLTYFHWGSFDSGKPPPFYTLWWFAVLLLRSIEAVRIHICFPPVTYREDCLT